MQNFIIGFRAATTTTAGITAGRVRAATAAAAKCAAYLMLTSIEAQSKAKANTK